MLFGMGGKLLYAATRVALPPLALAHMGLADYGLWAACFVLVGYLGMAASGFTLVYLRSTAQHHAAGDMASISRLLSTGILAMAGVGAALLGALWLSMPHLLALFKVPPGQQAVASLLWLGAAGVFLADMSLGAFANVLHAIGRVRQEQQVWVVAFVLEALLIVAFLNLGWGVLGLLAAFALRYLFSASANAWLACRALPGVVLSWRLFSRPLLRTFFGFGAGMQLSGLLASALHSADRLLAGALLGPQATALVDLAAKLPITAASIGSSASAVAVSASARHDMQGRSSEVLQVYQDASRITVASLALTLPFLAAFAQPLSLAWLGAGEAQASMAGLLPFMAAALHAHMLTGPVTAVSRGRGRLGSDFSYAAVRFAALGLAAGAFLASGSSALIGLVAALCGAQMAAASGFLAVAHRRLCGHWRGLASGVFAPSLGVYALAGALHLALTQAGPAPTDRAGALWAVAGAGLLWLPLSAALLAALLLPAGEAQRLVQRALQPLNWKRT
jgi:O-antigen/teichoic acid export membrane protein